MGSAYYSKSKVRAAEKEVANNPLYSTTKLVTNAGVVQEAYFRSYGSKGTVSGKGLWDLLRTDASSNTPTAVDKATDLWSGANAYKGMISSYTSAAQQSEDDKVVKVKNIAAYLEGKRKYAFSFCYNPTSVDMTYAGIPEVDWTMYTSGLEKFNDLGANVSQSTISFNLLINRVHDMKYFDPSTGKLDGKFTTAGFAGRKPTEGELEDIYNKGTMYDIEFLLRTIVGIQINAQFSNRNATWDGKTADLGFLSGKPVELHLGRSLRYLGRVESVSIRHVLFTERMVPTFTEVGIVFTRIPDYAGNAIANPTTTAEPEKKTNISTLFGAPSNPNGYSYIDYSQGKNGGVDPGGSDGNPMTPY